MPLEKFKNYFVKTIYGVHKVEKDGSDEVWGAEYIIAKDVQDLYHGGGYNYIEYILDVMKENIELAHNGEMKDLKFYHN